MGPYLTFYFFFIFQEKFLKYWSHNVIQKNNEKFQCPSEFISMN